MRFIHALTLALQLDARAAGYNHHLSTDLVDRHAVFEPLGRRNNSAGARAAIRWGKWQRCSMRWIGEPHDYQGQSAP